MNNKFSNINIKLPTSSNISSSVSSFPLNAANMLETNFSKISNTFESYPETYRILIILAVVAIISIVSYLIYYRLSGGAFAETIFIPNLRNDASKGMVIPYKSVPEVTPNKYTYSFWLYINGAPNDTNYWGNYRYNEWKHVMHRGGKMVNGKVQFQSPGFWLSPTSNKLYAAISTKGDIEYITLGDVAMDKWVNIVFVINQNIIELYKNCLLEKTFALYNPIVNLGTQPDLYVTQDGGFAGNIAYIQYFNRSLKPTEIQAMCRANKPIFDQDMKARLTADLSGYSPGVPIGPTPEPPPDEPDNGGDDQGGTCS